MRIALDTIKRAKHYNGFYKYIIPSIIIYYSSFFCSFILLLHTGISGNLSTFQYSAVTETKPAHSFVYYFKSIVVNNLTLDSYYILGSLSLSFATIIRVLNSNYLENIFLINILKSIGTIDFFKGVMPQFFPETMGYVFGISFSLYVTSYIIDFFDGTRKENIYSLSTPIYLIIVSILLILIGGVIESYLFFI